MKKKEIRVTKEQFERLIESVHDQKYGKTLKENTGKTEKKPAQSNQKLVKKVPQQGSK